MNQNLIINMLLGQLKNQNPNAYQEFQGLMNSGKNPNQVLNELLASGRFNQSQVQQAQRMAQQYMQNFNTQSNQRRF